MAAYFETSQDVAFGIIDRSVFEQRLRDHYSTQGSSVRFDSAWYALRNTVYAIGCLSALSRGPYPSAFVEARSQAWRYFENALSVHTELIYARSGMDAVQVMIAMVSGEPVSFHLQFWDLVRCSKPTLTYECLTGLFFGSPRNTGA